MKRDEELIEVTDEVSQIPFILKQGLEVVYTSSSFNYKELYIEKKIYIQNNVFTLLINKSEEKVLPLLEYYIFNKVKEENDKRRLIVNELLSGRSIEREKIEELYPFLLDKFTMMIICIDGNAEDIYPLIKEGYIKEKAVVTLYENKIIILGNLDLVYDHAQSIKETLASNISGFKSIIYCRVHDYTQIRSSLEKCNGKIFIVNKFKLEIDIINQEEVLFEEIIDSISEKKKNELVHDFHKGFKKIDNEMIKTIDIFLKSGLNLSEASKELYIHRNTLIYRIDKLLKYTGFDIRNFNEAIIFKIIYSLWKEENKINNKN